MTDDPLSTNYYTNAGKEKRDNFKINLKLTLNAIILDIGNYPIIFKFLLPRFQRCIYGVEPITIYPLC